MLDVNPNIWIAIFVFLMFAAVLVYSRKTEKRRLCQHLEFYQMLSQIRFDTEPEIANMEETTDHNLEPLGVIDIDEYFTIPSSAGDTDVYRQVFGSILTLPDEACQSVNVVNLSDGEITRWDTETPVCVQYDYTK